MGSLLHGAQHAAGRPQTLPVTGLPWPVSFLFLQLLGAPGVPTSLSLLPAPWAVVLTASTTTSAHLLILGARCPQHLQLGAIRASRNNRVRSCHRCEPSPASLRPPPALRLLVPSLLIPSRSLPPPYPKDSCLSRCVIICFVFSPQYVSLLGFCVCLYVLDNCLVGCKSHEGRGLAPPVHSPPEPETAPGTAGALSRCSLIG